MYRCGGICGVDAQQKADRMARFIEDVVTLII